MTKLLWSNDCRYSSVLIDYKFYYSGWLAIPCCRHLLRHIFVASKLRGSANQARRNLAAILDREPSIWRGQTKILLVCIVSFQGMDLHNFLSFVVLSIVPPFDKPPASIQHSILRSSLGICLGVFSYLSCLRYRIELTTQP